MEVKNDIIERQKRKRKINAKYYKNHSEYMKIYVKQWRREHHEQFVEYQVRYRRKLRQKAVEKLGSKCIRCGFSDVRALEIDHVNGDGLTERKALGVNFRIYRQVLTDTTGKYQLLCANCHRIKTFEESLKKVK